MVNNYYDVTGDYAVETMNIPSSSGKKNWLFEYLSCSWIRRRHVLVILLFWNAVISYADRTIISIAVIPMAKEYNWSDSVKGGVLSSFFYGYMCTQLLGGYLSHVYGGKQTLAISCLLWSIFTFLTPICAPNMPLLILCRVMLGLFQGLGYPPLVAMISAHIPAEEHTRAIAFVLSGSYLGAAVGNAVSAHLVEVSGFGWPSIFYIFGAVGVLWVIPWLCFNAEVSEEFEQLSLKEQRHQMEEFISPSEFSSCPTTPDYGHIEKFGDEIQLTSVSHSTFSDDTAVLRNHTISQSSSDICANRNKWEAIPWGVIFRSREVWAIIIAHFCQSWGYGLVINWLPSYYFDTFGLDIKHIGYFAIVPYFAQGIVGMFAGILGDHLLALGYSKLFVRKSMQVVGMCTMALGMMLAVLVKGTEIEAMLFITLSMSLYCLTFAGVSVNQLDVAPNYASIVYGIGNTAGQLPGIIGVGLTGLILEATDKSWLTVFSLASAVSVCGAVAWLLMAGVEVVIH